MKKQTNFNQDCYQLLKKIPIGKVTTYKAIANKLETKAYRTVGKALNKNPNPFRAGGSNTQKSI